MTNLGYFEAQDFASIQPFRKLQDLVLDIGTDVAKIALLPCSLTKLVVSLQTWSIDWETFWPLCCLQELEVYNHSGESAADVQLDDSFATALPLLRVFHVIPGYFNQPNMALKTTANVVMPHLVQLAISNTNMVHLDLHFMSALNSLSLVNCDVSIVSAACSTMVLEACCIRESLVLVTPNLRVLTIDTGGRHFLDGSRCWHALSIVCKDSSIEWVGAKPNVEHLTEVVY